MKNEKKVLDFFGFIICVAVVLGIVSVIALVGGSIMKIFGFRYESVGKIILFFLIFAIVGFPTEVFAQALPNALLSLDRISFLGAKVLFAITSLDEVKRDRGCQKEKERQEEEES